VGFVGTIVRTAQSYPALIPLLAASAGLAVWSYRRRRYALSTLAVLLGGALCLLYTGGSPARALSLPAAVGGGPRPPQAEGQPAEPAADGGQPTSARSGRGLPAIARVRPHPRFPVDFPVPATFRVESSSGGSPGANLSVRFRFRGEGADAVRALRVLGEANGWEVEQKAPHRLVLRKSGRTVESWFSYPAHSVVLDIADGR
jgi:hypothetical protein